MSTRRRKNKIVPRVAGRAAAGDKKMPSAAAPPAPDAISEKIVGVGITTHERPESVSLRRRGNHVTKPRPSVAAPSRGMLLDIVVFFINLVLMNQLTGHFDTLVRLTGEDDPQSKLALGLCLSGALVLPAAGAVLKRWHFHDRRFGGPGEGREKQPRDFDPLSGAAGCLFNPIFYFCLTVVISSAVMALLGELVFGKDLQNNGAVFVPLVFGMVGFCGLQTFLVYRYFSPPKRAPKGEFWRGPQSELLGDVCIFSNMIIFQILWNFVVGQISFGRVTDFGDLAGRIFFLSFVALLIYFPPRIFYLAEDIGRRAAWLTMLLANSPTILRVLFGDNPGASGLLQ